MSNRELLNFKVMGLESLFESLDPSQGIKVGGNWSFKSDLRRNLFCKSILDFILDREFMKSDGCTPLGIEQSFT